MERFPDPPDGWQQLIGCITEPLIKAKLLLTGIELDVFNCLQQPRTVAEVTDMLDSHQENTGYFLEGLCACDLVVKKDGTYRVADTFAPFLVPDSEFYIGPSLEINNWWTQPAMEDMPGMVKNGPNREGVIFSPETWARSVTGVASMQKMGRLQHIRDVVKDMKGFSGFKKMLDLGCGPGLISMGILEVHPSLRAVLFDLPPVLEQTAQYVSKYGMQERVQLIPGDMLSDDFGNGYDLIIALNVLSGAKSDLDTMMQKLYDAMNPGGVLFSQNGVYDAEAPGSAKRLLGNLSPVMMDYNFMLTRGAVADASRRVGFRSVETLKTGPGVDFDIVEK